MARVWRVGAPWHARARRGEARWARPRGDRGSLSRSRLLPRGREDERAPFRDPRGGERKSDLRCPLFVDRRGGETRDGLTRDARVVNARSAYLEFVGHGVGSAARAKFWPGPRPASADARSARFSEGCRKPETKTSSELCDGLGPNRLRHEMARFPPLPSPRSQPQTFHAPSACDCPSTRVDPSLGVRPAFRRLPRRPPAAMASASAAGSLATARPNARSLRASAWRVEKAALLSQGGPSRRARSARGAGASRGRTGAVVVEAKIWTDDGRRRAAELMGLTREVRPSPRAAPRPGRIFFIFLSRALFPDCVASERFSPGTKAHRFAAFQTECAPRGKISPRRRARRRRRRSLRRTSSSLGIAFFCHGASRDVSSAVCSRERTESASSFQTLTRYVTRRDRVSFAFVRTSRRKPRTGKS